MPLPPSPAPASPIRLTAWPLCDRCQGPLDTRSHACLGISPFNSQVLASLLPAGTTASREQLQVAVRYLLAELPLFTDAAAIVNQPASVFAYHQAPAFLHAFYQGAYGWKPAARQGFAVIEPARDPAVVGGEEPGRCGRVATDML